MKRTYRPSKTSVSQDKEVGTLSRKVSMLETGEEPKHHITVHVYKSRFLLHDFIFQTSIYENTPAMAFSVLLLIPFRPCFVARIKECQQTEDCCIATVHVIVTATNGQSSTKGCFSLQNFLCNGTLRGITRYRERTNSAI